MLFMKTNNILPDLLSLKTALDKNNTNQYINTRAHIIRNPNILLGLSGLRTASESSPSSSTATTSSSSPLLADTSRQDNISHQSIWILKESIMSTNNSNIMISGSLRHHGSPLSGQPPSGRKVGFQLFQICLDQIFKILLEQIFEIYLD